MIEINTITDLPDTDEPFIIEDIIHEADIIFKQTVVNDGNCNQGVTCSTW